MDPRPITLTKTTCADIDVHSLLVCLRADLVARYGRDVAGPDPTPDEVAMLARSADDPMGCVVLRRLDRGEVELTRMFVKREARGRGVSRLLLDEAHAAANDLGLTGIRLTTGTEQPEALGLYKSAGYFDVTTAAELRVDPQTRHLHRHLR